MKKVFYLIILVNLGLLMFFNLNLQGAEDLFQPYGSYYDLTITENNVSISSYTVVKSSSVLSGVQRVLQNQGVTNIRYSQDCSTMVTNTQGAILYPSESLFIGDFFGDIWLLGESATNILFERTMTKD